MFILAGLGNPGREYNSTRHNIGFAVIDRLADEMGTGVDVLKHRALLGQGRVGGEKVILAKPQTYMNVSGASVRELVDYYKIDPARELIVIYDDISLDVGLIRVRVRGSAGGHNGIKSIIASLGTEEFMRVRLGIGEKPRGWDLADYVLGRFSKEELSVMEESVGRAAQAVRMMLSGEAEKAMNEFNRKSGA